MKKLILLLFLLISHITYAKKIAIFLYVSEEQGDFIYDNYTKNLGFDRKLSIRKFKNIEYHLTLGFIENIDAQDTKELKFKIYNELKPLIKNIKFKFGAASLLGKNIPYIVAIPQNIEVFKKFNLQIDHLLKDFKGGIYTLNDFTKSDYFIPHLSLNAKLFDKLDITNLPKTLMEINNKMNDTEIELTKLIVKIE